MNFEIHHTVYGTYLFKNKKEIEEDVFYEWVYEAKYS